MAEGGHTEFCQIKMFTKKAPGLSIRITQCVKVYGETNVIDTVRIYAEKTFENHKLEVKHDGKVLEMTGKSSDDVLNPNEENELFKHICTRHGYKMLGATASPHQPDFPDTSFIFGK